MPPPLISFAITAIDMTVLNRQLSLAQEFTRRTPALAVNTAALQIAVTASRNTPFVDTAKMDAELMVQANPVMGKRGRLLKITKKNRRLSSNLAADPARSSSTEFDVASLIVIARGHMMSNYNLLTGSRWAIPNVFQGRSRAAALLLIQQYVDRMLKGRHSSGHFLQAGWGAAITILRPLADRNFKSLTRMLGAAKPGNMQLGNAIPAQEGQLLAVCVIENKVGVEGANAASQNAALWRYGAAPLQDAVDTVGQYAINYYLSKGGADLAKAFNAMGVP